MANHSYMRTNPVIGGSNDEIFMILNFSGGGTRAAAFSYGVLEALRDVQVTDQGERKRLIDMVDAITAVSGGSITAAYYGLYGDRIFADYEDKFLKKNFEGMIKRRFYLPWYWFKFLSPHYGRSEMTQEMYDKLLFEGKTIRDFMEKPGPFIGIIATDAMVDEQFSFVPPTFQLICSDLLDFPISRAVTASTAVPGLFNSIVLENHTGACDYEMPPWAVEALQEGSHASRVYKEALRKQSYMDLEERPYIHLFDGGLSDNLATRDFAERLFERESVIEALKRYNLIKARKVVYVVVNAEVTANQKWNKRSDSIGLISSILIGTGVPIKRYNFETVKYMEKNFAKWQDELRNYYCPEGGDDCDDIDTYFIYLDFDSIENEQERKYLRSIPTSFYLAPEMVDHLRGVAKQLLHESSAFQRLTNDLQ